MIMKIAKKIIFKYYLPKVVYYENRIPIMVDVEEEYILLL